MRRPTRPTSVQDHGLTHRAVEAGERSRAIAMVDIDEDPEQMLSELSKITTPTRTVVIVLSKEFNERRVLQAMQAGARHFLRKSAIATELDTVLEQLLAQRPEASTRLGT